MKQKMKKSGRIISFVLASILLITSFVSSVAYAKDDEIPTKQASTRQERIQLAKELKVEKWIDGDGYLSEDYYADKTDLELSQQGVAPLIKSVDLNNGIMPLTVTKYQKVTYGNTVVGYFQVDGVTAICCEHDRGTPVAGSPTGTPELITDQNLRTIMYYGYNGPANIFSSDLNRSCVATSLALSYYVRGLSSTGMGGPHSAGAETIGMSQLIYKAEQKAYVPDGFKVYRVTTNNGSTQRLMYSIYTPKTYTNLTVQKAWDDQNNKYNLRPSRVKINLYRWTNKNSTKTLVGSAYITKNDNWKVTWNNLLRNDGTTTYNYTAEEEAVPGYTGKMVWKGSYEAGRVGTLTNTLQSSAVKLLKTSSMPDVTNGNDCYSLKGAEYGVYSDSSLSGASKVGVLTTDENGESNTLTLNAGTYYVRETTAPKGYALDKTAYTITIKPNETYTLKVSDTIREVSVPDEYIVNDGVVTFTVAEDNTITIDSNTATGNSMQFKVEADGTASLSVEDTLAPYTLKVLKANEKDVALEGAEFTVYEDKDCTKELFSVATDDAGIAEIKPFEVEKKYYIKETKAPQGYRIPKDINGNDYVYEFFTKFNDKRQFEYYVNGELHTKDSGDYAIEGTAHERIVNLKVVNQTGVKMPETGTHSTLILLLIGVICMVTVIIRQIRKGTMEEKDNGKI